MKFMVNYLYEVFGVWMFLGKMYFVFIKVEIIFDLNMMKCILRNDNNLCIKIYVYLCRLICF